jgi:hypothetical protein
MKLFSSGGFSTVPSSLKGTALFNFGLGVFFYLKEKTCENLTL